MLRGTFESLKTGWNQFWFRELSPGHIVPTRIAISAVVFAWFASYWSEVAIWFGPDGILGLELGSKLVAFEDYARWQVWSPLWWSDSQVLYYSWIVLGCVVSVLGALGVGGRWVFVALFLLVVSWCNRLTWVSGLVEPAVCAFAGYFILCPGPNLLRRNDSVDPEWLPNAVIRLVQVHVWLLLAATLVSQLIGVIWWRGEAIWWLASAKQSLLFTAESLSDRAAFVNGISHAWILFELAALWFLTTHSGRLLGLLFGILSAFAIAFAANQVLYGLLLVAAMTAYIQPVSKS